MSTDANNKREIIEQAAAWHSRLSATDVSAEDWRGFQAWLDKDAEHRDVFESMERMSGALRSLGEEPRLRALHDSAPSMSAVSDEPRIVPLRSRSQTRTWDLRPRHMALAAGVLVALIVPLLYFMGSEQVPEATIYETAVGERETIELDDGSSLTLNANSSIAVTMTDDDRKVILRNGDLFLEVAADADRRFSVGVANYRVTATGTAFDVRYRKDPAKVIVHEGQVLVALGDDVTTELHAGQQLILEPGATATDLSPEELSKLSDWRNGWLHFDDHSLSAVISELGPYLDKRIVLTSRKVEALKVGGSFNVDNVDSMLTALESLLPVVITRQQDRIIIDHESDTTRP